MSWAYSAIVGSLASCDSTALAQASAWGGLHIASAPACIDIHQQSQGPNHAADAAIAGNATKNGAK